MSDSTVRVLAVTVFVLGVGLGYLFQPSWWVLVSLLLVALALGSFERTMKNRKEGPR